MPDMKLSKDSKKTTGKYRKQRDENNKKNGEKERELEVQHEESC